MQHNRADTRRSPSDVRRYRQAAAMATAVFAFTCYWSWGTGIHAGNKRRRCCSTVPVELRVTLYGRLRQDSTAPVELRVALGLKERRRKGVVVVGARARG